jgi:Holliday junction resolvase-like predicted endonuclease
VEVKTRYGRPRRAGETPAEWVTLAKQRQIARLALAYAARNGLLEGRAGEEEIPLRFDVAAVYLPADADEGSLCSVDLTRGAFSVPDDAFGGL